MAPGSSGGAGGREARWVTPGAFMHVLNDVFALTAAPWRFWRLLSGYAARAPRGSAAFTALTVWRWNAGEIR